jgi:hypothetical protein
MTDWNERDGDDIQIVDTAASDAPADAFTGSEPTVDKLIDAYEHYDQAERDARNSRIQIAAALAARSRQTGGCRTARVRGERRRVKIEFPDDSWDQSRLKEAYYAYPQFRDEFLTIASIRVRLREYGKAVRESGPEAFETFKGMLVAANRGAKGLPRIVIEQ